MRSPRTILMPLALCLALSCTTSLTGCSSAPKTRQVIVQPPTLLLEPVQDPPLNPDILTALRKGDTDKAAVGYARYVLDVRRTVNRANGQLAAIERFYDGLADELDEDANP